MITQWDYLLLLSQLLNLLYVYFYILLPKIRVISCANNNNYLPIIYYNSTLLPKIQFKSRTEKIVSTYYNPIPVPKVRFKSRMQEILTIYHEYMSIKYSMSNIKINLL